MLLSVIIPIHNTSEYLVKCVSSVIAQGLNNNDFEIILVENASTDNSLEVCKQLKTKYDKNNIVIIHTDTPGVSNARNLGIQSSHGKYISFIDSDDWIETGMYDYLLSEESRMYDLFITGIKNDYSHNKRQIEEVSSTIIICENTAHIKEFLSQMDTKQKVWTLNVIWNKLYKADILREHQILFREDINLGEDFVFNCLFFSRAQTIKVLNTSFYHYMHRGTVTLVNKFRTDVLFRRPIMYNAYCNLYRHYGIFEDNKLKIDLLEGKLLFGSLYTIFNRDCNLSFHCKLDFIKEICESKYFSLAGLYLTTSHSPYHKLLNTIIVHKNYIVLYIILYLKFNILRCCK